MTATTVRRRRVRRRIRVVGLVALLAGVLAAVGFVIWAEHPMAAEAGPLARVRTDPALRYRDVGSAVVLQPVHPDGTGLVFLAGARVDAPAYAWKLSGLADNGVTVVIVRPVLNLALAENRPLSAFEAAAPGVRRWLVGGHSLGGVRACAYADDGGVAGLVLLGSYCSVDLSRTTLPVLSIAGSRDGLSTPERIRDARDLLPVSAEATEILGAVHAQFGDYGPQPGDGTPTTTDAAVRSAITTTVLEFLSRRIPR